MKKSLSIILVLLLSIGLCACGSGKTAKLHVTEKNWYEFGSEVTGELNQDFKDGDKISFESSSDINLKVVKVTDDYVTIKSNYILSSSKASPNGIDMSAKTKTFKIYKGESVTLSTLSFDAGWNYQIAFE